ncbi:MAG: hypothetical protein KJ749_13845 [Planctomycetes bacterium]|nr:hypothetical protein [Planctomycetota bacterium]
MGSRQHQNHQHRRRGVALLLVLFAVAISATLALSFLGGQSTSLGIARNIQNHSPARYVAESGLELAIAYVQADEDWRTDQSQGTWVTDEPFGDGTFTIVGQDGEDTDGDGVVDGDGDLADDDTDLLTLTATGTVNGASHIARAVLTPIPGNDLVGHWKLDETTGLLASDSSGTGNNGTVTNAGTPGWESAYIDGGLHLDGTNDFIAVADHETLDLSDAGTLALWFWMDSFKSFAGLIHKGDTTSFSDESYSLQFWDGNRRIYFGLAGSPSSRSMQTNTSFNNNRWYHVAAVWDAGGMYVYVDGTLDISSGNTVSVVDSPGGLNIGAQLPVYYNPSYKNLPFDGIIDDVRVYNRALTAAEVAVLAGGGSVGGGGGNGCSVRWVD